MSELREAVGALLRRGPFRRADGPFRTVRVAGRDAADFLQRLCSQDVQGLAPGGCAPAAFLDAKGRLQHTCVVAGLGDSFVLETQAHQADGLVALLDRYHFTEKLTLALAAAGCDAWVGAAAPSDLDLAPGHVRALDDGGVALHLVRRGLHQVRVHGSEAERTALRRQLPGGLLDDATGEVLRMAVGLVRVGADTEAGTLALEADLEDHVSRTKGCYTGQEIVARIDTYGHVNRRLVLLQLAGDGAIDAPVPLCEAADGIAVGRVLRAVPVPGAPFRIGLGYLPKDFWQPGTALRLGAADGPAVMVAEFGVG